MPRPSRPARRAPQSKPSQKHQPSPAAETAWEEQAIWYDQRHGESGDTHHQQVIIPALLRHLLAKPGQTVLDCCCGQGVVGRHLAAQGLQVLGVDAAPALIAKAQERASAQERYVVGDARNLQVPEASVDHAVVVLALQDLDPLLPVYQSLARIIKPGGRLLCVLTHPCFRVPQHSDWGWDEAKGLRYRRIEAYLQPQQLRIRNRPGADPGLASQHHHRPLSAYINAAAQAGLPIVACEELTEPPRSRHGPRAGAEDRAARAFPMFLLLVAQRPVLG